MNSSLLSHNGGAWAGRSRLRVRLSSVPPAHSLDRPLLWARVPLAVLFVQQLYDQTLVGTKIGSEKVSRCAAPHSHPHPRGSFVAPQLAGWRLAAARRAPTGPARRLPTLAVVRVSDLCRLLVASALPPPSLDSTA